MADNTDTALARLDGFLKAFEWLNHKTNHGCNYFVLPLPEAATAPDALAARFGLPPSAFRVEPLTDLDGELRAVFARFLLLFLEPHADHLTDLRQSFALSHDSGRAGLLDELVAVVRSLGTRGGCSPALSAASCGSGASRTTWPWSCPTGGASCTSASRTKGTPPQER